MSQPRVVDVMSPDVVVITVGTSISDAARLLGKRRVAHSAVVSITGEPLGTLSGPEFVSPQAREPGATVERVMSRGILRVRPTDQAVAVARLLVDEQLPCAVVVDDWGGLIGVVGVLDILQALVRGAATESGEDVSREPTVAVRLPARVPFQS